MSIPIVIPTLGTVCESGTMKMMDCLLKLQTSTPSSKCGGHIGKAVDGSVVDSKESLWLELQKSWENIKVVLRTVRDELQ